MNKFRCYACGDAENTDAHCDINMFAGEPTQCPITGEEADWNTRVEQQPEAGEFTSDAIWNKGYRAGMRVEIERSKTRIDRLEREATARDIRIKRFKQGQKSIIDDTIKAHAQNEELHAQLAAKDEAIENLQEQLIKMCRVFHSIDCMCKWCNIARDRAVAGA